MRLDNVLLILVVSHITDWFVVFILKTWFPAPVTDELNSYVLFVPMIWAFVHGLQVLAVLIVIAFGLILSRYALKASIIFLLGLVFLKTFQSAVSIAILGVFDEVLGETGILSGVHSLFLMVTLSISYCASLIYFYFKFRRST